MKKGDKVMVFEDPITKQKPEGEAKIIKILETIYPDGILAEVKFADDPKLYQRVIIAE